MRKRRLVGAIALLACAGTIAGCGGSSETTDSGLTLPKGKVPVSISPADLQREKPGTAQYAALQWWRAVQLNDPELAVTLYAEEPSLPDLAGQFNTIGGALAGLPKIEKTASEGPRTVLVIDWTKRKQKPHSTEVQLRMVRVGDQWKLADNQLLDVLLQEREKRSQGAGP